MPLSSFALIRGLRLSLATGTATALAYGLDAPLPYLAVLAFALVAATPAPPPPIRKSLILLALLVVTCLWGLAVGRVIAGLPAAGVLLALGGVGVAAVLDTRSQLALPPTLLSLGSTVIAVIASLSVNDTIAVAAMLMGSVALALVLNRLGHWLLPDPSPAARRHAPAPAAPAVRPVRVGLRSAVLMLPPLLIALAWPDRYLMVLMKGTVLSRQVDRAAARSMAGEIILSTLLGGLVAMALWRLYLLAPGTATMTALFSAAAFGAGVLMHGRARSRFGPTFWKNVLVNVVVLLGPVAFSTDTLVDHEMLLRTGIFLCLALYMSAVIWLFDLFGIRAPATRS